MWLTFAWCALLIQLLWIVVYGGCSWLTAERSLRVSLATPWDSTIPFVPWAAFAYLSLGPMLWLSPFILRSAIELKRMAKALAWLIVISGIVFVLLPADAPVDSDRAADKSSILVNFADWINLDHNLCPSLHVGMAVLCASAYSRGGKPAQAVLFWSWAAVIAASTLLLRDHYIVDVLAGTLLGLVVADRILKAER
jgi:membrane-associated phospholipid phosphatase